MNKKIAVIRGDGIGPEITEEALKVLNEICRKFGHSFEYTDVLMGGIAIDKAGTPLPQETIDICLNSDAVLLGAIGGPKWDSLPGNQRPEAGLLGLRGALKLFANIRPAKLLAPLASACPLKPEITSKGLDLVIVRELTGGVYFGERKTYIDENGAKTAVDSMKYSDYEIERICRTAFETARKRRCKVHSIDKANVLDSSRLWREIAHKTAELYPDVEYFDMLVDNCAMQLVRNPAQFDVIVTENMFGDILSDEASMLTGSLGMLPSASQGDGSFGLYEPIHGSAPDIAGLNQANPIATILSAAMMLRHSFDMPTEADAIERAVNTVLEKGYRTGDIMSEGEGLKLVSCSEMGGLICGEIR
ncbi:MAG: 3-isopropylmalate dehydrogenase [Oscillospiraceae bacterium]|nr:3-isopropylmalate dehydrogenase [Oscillospiraceae bacterium]